MLFAIVVVYNNDSIILFIVFSNFIFLSHSQNGKSIYEIYILFNIIVTMVSVTKYFYIFVMCFSVYISMVDSYNMNNFPIIKRLFDRRNQNNYSKKSYVDKNANSYMVNKIILDDMASKIVGPKKNNTNINLK
jgi:hypothetical protein